MINLVNIDIIQQSIAEAQRTLPINWPLKSSIAINPLWDFRDKPFEQALKQMQKYLPVRGCLSQNEYLELYKQNKISESALRKALQESQFFSNVDAEQIINQFIHSNSTEIKKYFNTNNGRKLPSSIKEEISLFISRYFDEEQLRNTDDPTFTLWNAWKQKISSDEKWTELLSNLPVDPMAALEKVLNKMQVKNQELTDLFSLIFCQLIGWHGFIKWLESRTFNPLVKKRANLIEVLLIWCSYLHINEIKIDTILENNKSSQHENEPSVNTEKVNHVWQRAYELTYEESLISKLNYQRNTLRNKPLAQFVFCIDVRSEGVRRHIEAVNSYQTFGFAGFFGSIFTLKETQTKKCTLQAPALVESDITVYKNTKPSTSAEFFTLLNNVLKVGKDKHFSTFAFFEMIGPWMMLSLLQKTFFPRVNIHKNNARSTQTNPFLTNANIDNTVSSMFSFLTTIGLTKHFSPLVIICGHQAKTNNNPFQATFDCGACGGNSGSINAKITSEILNNEEIRNKLLLKGIKIPPTTRFVAACHETTTDSLLFAPEDISNNPYVRDIQLDLHKALENLKSERELSLPGSNYYTDRAYHFAELIPEWGLAKNAAMIIGPRSITENVNLNNRVFLHSYEYQFDHDATILESILTAPVIVAHWINSQYYFSATDPEIYGAGNKAMHNVVSKIGVMEGNQSDLKIGLPLQSVFFKNNRVHEPLKLLVIIYADPSQVNLVFNRQPQIKSLFDLGWLNLRIIKPSEIAYA